MVTKICSNKNCKNPEKELNKENFQLRKDTRKWRNECRDCKNEKNYKYNIVYRAQNRNKINENARISYQNNKEKTLVRNKEYRDNNKDKERLRNKKYRDNNKEKEQLRHTIYAKEKRIKNPAFKLRINISSYILKILKKNNGSKRGKSIMQYLPYNFEELKLHLESLFEPWMNWENCGRYNSETWTEDSNTWTWNIDHIIPQSLLPYDSMDHPNFQKAWALSNLRPYSAKQNLLDGVTRIRHNISA